MTKNEYNGWYNYETWVVNLWMDNDEGSYTYWRETAIHALEDADNDKDDATSALAQMLESEHEEALPELQGFAADLLSAAMSEVNWYEIAEHLVEDNYEPDGNEEEEESEGVPNAD